MQESATRVSIHNDEISEANLPIDEELRHVIDVVKKSRRIRAFIPALPQMIPGITNPSGVTLKFTYSDAVEGSRSSRIAIDQS